MSVQGHLWAQMTMMAGHATHLTGFPRLLWWSSLPPSHHALQLPHKVSSLFSFSNVLSVDLTRWLKIPVSTFHPLWGTEPPPLENSVTAIYGHSNLPHRVSLLPYAKAGQKYKSRFKEIVYKSQPRIIRKIGRFLILVQVWIFQQLKGDMCDNAYRPGGDPMDTHCQ